MLPRVDSVALVYHNQLILSVLLTVHLIVRPSSCHRIGSKVGVQRGTKQLDNVWKSQGFIMVNGVPLEGSSKGKNQRGHRPHGFLAEGLPKGLRSP